MVDITEAKKEVDETFKYLNDIAQGLCAKYTVKLDKYIKELGDNGVDKYSNKELRDLMVLISVEAYILSTKREQSSLREACALAIYKEGVANTYNTGVGAVEARKNQAVVTSMDKQTVSVLYTSVADKLQVRCDEAHRVVSVLNGVLISRAADAKNNFSPRSEVDTMDLDTSTNELDNN